MNQDGVGEEQFAMSAEPIERAYPVAPEFILWRSLDETLTVDDIEGLPINDLYQVELNNGRLLVTPSGDVPHQRLCKRLEGRLEALLPPGYEVLQGVNVYDGDKFKWIPDVSVIDPSLLIRRDMGVSSDGLILAVEITSPSNRSIDLVDKKEWFEKYSIPYLLVDRKFEPHEYRVFGDWPDWAAPLLEP